MSLRAVRELRFGETPWKRHQYIDRRTGRVCTERLAADGAVQWLYARQREQPGWLLRALTSPYFNRLLGHLRYDLYLGNRRACGPTLLRRLGADAAECLDDPITLDTPRKVFERRIRYWDTWPLPVRSGLVVSPADARVLVGSLNSVSPLFLKEKFFTLEELVGNRGRRWSSRFRGGATAVFRLTPDRYHYNHVPVSGRVLDSPRCTRSSYRTGFRRDRPCPTSHWDSARSGTRRCSWACKGFGCPSSHLWGAAPSPPRTSTSTSFASTPDS